MEDSQHLQPHFRALGCRILNGAQTKKETRHCNHASPERYFSKRGGVDEYRIQHLAAASRWCEVSGFRGLRFRVFHVFRCFGFRC